ncbi:hypothetical protein VSH64_25100 [Amycolatopsis rhabdoformis]|uniref:DUF1003 domain-containing protein n=1 Tax=Amycolatopsis rhabdoformis TaxID=1448059 RepID=A0ABZ1HXA9_9PSEU|nr:hypothetical protein [Amycolatopsis rhabdoformis]WSE26156.1 hypothetical protein VSH64_25100 [Amycolatopsis rhabdoformis]
MSREPRSGGTVRNKRMVQLGYAFALIAVAVVTVVNALVGWASNAYNWHPPVFIFTNGIMIIAWIGVFSMTHLERGRRQREDELEAIRCEHQDLLSTVEELGDKIDTLLTELSRARLADRYLKAIDGAERPWNVVPLGDRHA